MSEFGIKKGSRTFYDDVYFPRGFSRSGDFTIAESTLLQDYGTTLKQLHDGFLSPENEAEERFVQVANGKLEANSSLERVWVKYIKATSPKSFYTLNSKCKTNDSGEITSSEYSMEL